VVQDLEASLQRAKELIENAVGLYESPWWDFLYETVAEVMAECSREMTEEVELAKIYRAQGGYTSLQGLINGIMKMKDGEVQGTTIKEMEEEYERRNQELDDLS